MALKYAPTMVIGLRDGGDKKGGSDELGEMLENARSWLSEYYPQVCPIVKFGMADEQQLTDLTERVGESVKSNLNDGLRRWLEAIAEVGRLEEVRRSGFEIVGVERLNRRVILLLPPNCLEQPALTVLKALSEASKYLDAGVQVLAMVITRGERPKISSLPLREWQEAAKGLTFANIILVHRYRSDGSTVREGDLPVVLQFLLLAALAPYEANEHWLFSLYGDQPNLSTVGIGLVYVPLTQISKAAGCYLAYQLSSQAVGKQPHPRHSEWEQRLVKIFDEKAFWQSLFAGIEEIAEAKFERDELPEKVFQVALKTGLVRMDLSGVPWWRWRDRLADYEMMWRMLLRDFWLPKMELNARAKQREAAKAFESVLDEIVRDGRNVFETVEKLMEQMVKHLQGWRCDDPQIPRGIERAEVEKAYEALEQALMEVPHPNAILARLLLSGAVIAYVTFALARWSFLSGFLANWLKNFFPFIEPWHIPAVIGAMGFLAFLRVAIGGFNILREAHERVEEAKDKVLEAIQREINSILRELGLQLLQGIQRNFLSAVKSIANMNREASKGIERLRGNWKAEAENFSAQDNPMTRAVIRSWSELKPIIDERMKGQDWLEMWRQVLKGAGIQTFSEWCNRIKDGKAGEKIAKAAEMVWREKLQGNEMRRLSFYLKPHENYERVIDEFRHCYEQARAFLWSQASEGLQWQLHADGEDALNNLLEETLRSRFGDTYKQQWQKLTMPAIAGFLKIGRIEDREET
ncbi:hypothetical protein [Fervidibacter sacchari]